MNRTHYEVVEDTDARLTESLITQNLRALHHIIHPDAIYTNQFGEVFLGAKNMPVNNPKLLRLTKIETIERSISFFNSVAVVTAIEKHEGEFREIPFKGLFSHTRMWKFNRHWQMIAATSVLI